MIIQRISKTGLPVETTNIFTGTFNNPTLGVYDFGIAGNTDQLVLNLNPRYYYLIDAVSLSATIDEGVYLESLNINPTIRLRFSSKPNFIYPFPLPAINYKDGLNWNFFFNTKQANDRLLISLDGILNQVPATVGIATIKILVSFVLYQEENAEAVKTLFGTKNQSVKCFNQ